MISKLTNSLLYLVFITLCLAQSACDSSGSVNSGAGNNPPAPTENSAPILAADAEVTMEENNLVVGTFVASDVDGDTITYSLSGDSAGLFTVSSMGELSFIDPPDYESTTIDFTASLNVIITASDGALSDTQSITITVEDTLEGDWVLLWSDEFDDAMIDASKWDHEVNCWGGGNNEQQCYTARADNSFIADGMLNIVAKEESYSGPAVNDDDPNYDPNDASTTLPYTSARLRTRGNFSFKYGRIEMRARMPAGQGMWPAFWMLPEDWVYGGWPLSGEIDIMEAANLDTENARPILGTTQYGMLWPNYVPKGGEYENPTANYHEEFHTYALEWEADELRWFVDGNHYYTQRSESWYNYVWGGQSEGWEVPNPRAPFDQEFHILLNVAVGGGLPGNPDTNWPEDRSMVVDYVRVYQCNAGSEAGIGCKGTVDPISASAEIAEDDGAPTLDRYTVFADGANALSLSAGDVTAENQIQIVEQESNDADILTESLDIGGDNGTVLDITFNATGSVLLSSADMSAVTGIDDGFSMTGGTGWSNMGELSFDLLVESIDSETQLHASLSDTDGNTGEMPIEISATGEWLHVALRISDLLTNASDNGGALDLTNLQNLFAIRASGAGIAEIQVDNVSVTCAVTNANISWLPDQSCALDAVAQSLTVESPTNIFVDAASSWPIDDCCGGASFAIVEDEPEYGNVVEFTYSGNTTVTYFQSAGIMDFSVFANGGTLEFDFLVMSEPSESGFEWLMKIDCVHPCSTGDVPLTDSVEGIAPVVGTWQHYTFDIDSLVNRSGSSLNLARVNTPLVIFPTWGTQSGARFRVDNVIYTAAP